MYQKSKKIKESSLLIRDTMFQSTVSKFLKEDGFLVIYISYAGGAGDEDYFLVNSEEKLQEVLDRAKGRRDWVSVFARSAIPIRGKADPILQEEALSILNHIKADKDEDEGLVLIRTDSKNLQLIWKKDWEWLSSAEEIKKWFTKNHDAQIVGFPPAWINDDIIEAHGK